MKYGVPTVLSTDDEGVSRSDMTQEYWRAMRTYNISYPQLKQMLRNSLEYSFLPGASLWSAPNKRATACVKDGPTCNKFLSSSERAKAEWNLEKQFEKFERGECCTAK
jgi:adenosine deaminase